MSSIFYRFESKQQQEDHSDHNLSFGKFIFETIKFNKLYKNKGHNINFDQPIDMKNSHKIRVKRLQNSPYAIQEGEPLGKGSFATIQRAYNFDNLSEQLAVKIISIHDDQTAKTIKSELQMLRQLPQHPNLVNCMKIQISSERNFYIIMEYCNQGNLEKYIFDHKNDLPQQKIWFFIKQFCEGYKVLYDRNIIHRDIKPQNILIKNGNFKISDFGLAKVISNSQINQNLSSKGTPLYMAPQLHYQKQGSSKVDVFSLGIILYRLAFRGKFPFFENGRTYHSIGQYFNQLMRKKLIFPPKHNRSDQLVNLIQKMLMKKKEDRISWKQIFQMQRVKRAVRNQRRKQIVPMQEFRKSLIIVSNASITDMKVMENTQSSKNLSAKGKQEKQEDMYLIIEQAFSKKNKSNVQKKLYKNKLIYTLIDITNRRVNNTILSEAGTLHPYIIQQLDKITNTGMLFCLHIISTLENISGDWNSIPTGEVLNFEDIFDNDRDIIVEKMKSKGINPETTTYKQGLYELQLYNLLTEFQDYPKQLQKTLKVPIALLIDVYDLVLKHCQEEKLEQEERTSFKKFLEEDIQKFHQYLYSLQNVKLADVQSKLKKMGLIFI